jgi:hypothetical protein
MTIKRLIGTDANQVPLNRDLGTMAYQDVATFAGPAFSAYASSSTTVANSAARKVGFQTKVFDTHGYYDNTTNYRFTPLVPGIYQVNANVSTSSGIAGTAWFQTLIYKNGGALTAGTSGYWTGTVWGASSTSDLVYLNGTTDYIEIYVQSDYTSGAGIQTSGITRFSATYIRGTY